jgi:hypothetical protein
MFKAHQILRTAVALTSPDGISIPAQTRVAVTKVQQDGTARVRVVDTTQPLLAKTHLTVRIGDVFTVRRGRPSKRA